MGKWIPG